MEGMEVEICNSEIYGVSYEVEKTDREISQQSLFLQLKVVHLSPVSFYVLDTCRDS